VLYLWLAFPLGLLYFVGLTVGLLVGTALTIVWVGLALLAATLVAAWAAEGMERQLANRLLGARVPERRPAARSTETLWGFLKSVFTAAALWKGLVFLFLKFPLGLAGWVASVVSLAFSAALLLAPWIEITGIGDVRVPYWSIDSPWDTLPLALGGLALLIVSLHLHNALGWLWARLAEGLLGGAALAAPAAEPAAATPA
jgi:hypothetical protein